MTSANAKQRINALTDELQRHNYLYYVKAQPEISDRAFDEKLHELEQLEAEYPELKRPDSPTQRVGGDLTKDFPTYTHRKPMLSLANSYSMEAIRDFHRRVLELSGTTSVPYIVQHKVDGVALSLHYENGLLVRGVTRGNGTAGDEITANVKTIRSIPLKLQGENLPPAVEVRGEVFMHRPDFDRMNADREARGDAPLMNPRNATAGTLKMQDSAIVAERPLDFYAYYLDQFESHDLDSDHAAMQRLDAWHFKVLPAMQRFEDFEKVIAYINDWESKRHDLDFEIDGIVVKVDTISLRDEIGRTSKSPRWAIAYKYEAERAETVLNDILYSVGRTGYINPVAVLEPVLLAGTTVKRASLYNYDEIERLGLHHGDTVLVEKSGEIIPKVLKAFPEKRAADAQPFSPPSECPACGTTLVKTSAEDVGHFCPNVLECPPQITGRIEHFGARRMMDIDGLGEQRVKLLVDEGLIENVADLYDLTKEQVMRLERHGEKSAEKLIQGIEASKQIPFERVLYALGIRHVGETVARKLAEAFGSMDVLMDASAEELADVHEIGETIATSVRGFFEAPHTREIIERLRRAGLQFEREQQAQASAVLDGKKLVVSGKFSISRDDLKAYIASHGGQNVSSVSGKTDYIVAGDGMGPSKREKAEKLGVAIISYDELVDMVGD